MKFGRRAFAAAGAALLVALVGCSAHTTAKPSASAQPTSVTVPADANGVQTVRIQATVDYRFVPSTIHVKPGKVQITLFSVANGGTHSLAFKPGGPTAEIPFLGPGDSKSITFTVSTPGSFEFYCTFHEALGQIGTLIVA